MKVVIPYIETNTDELRYCLRSIEKYIEDPEVIIIGAKPEWIKDVDYIFYKDNPTYCLKERNIFEKIIIVKEDFFFFNDDHILLEPFDKNTYHYSGTLSSRIKEFKPSNDCRKTVENTLELYGDIKNYYRHCPMFLQRNLLDPLTQLDWNKPWGYCLKSIYCHLNNIEGNEYNDLKIRDTSTAQSITETIEGRPYFSTDNGSYSNGMVSVLKKLFPGKSKFEK